MVRLFEMSEERRFRFPEGEGERDTTQTIRVGGAGGGEVGYWFGTEAAAALVVQYGSCASKISR